MKRIPIKVLSCTLIAAMVLPMAACNKSNSKKREKSRSGQVIAADSPWFNSTTRSFKADVDPKKTLEYASQQYVGSDDKYFALYTNGYYKIPSGNIDWNNFNQNDYSINTISFVDKETGKTEKTYDLKEYLPKNGYIENIEYEDGKFKFNMSSYDEKTNKMTVYKYACDAQTGKVTDKTEAPYDDSYHYYDRTFKFDPYTIKTSSNWDEEDRCYYTLFITEGDEDIEHSIELRDKKQNLYDIPLVLKVSEDKFLATAYTDNDPVYYEIDIKNYTATVTDSKKYDWLDPESIYNTFTGKDGTTYFSSASGISKINLEKKTTEEVLNYSWCSINRAYLGYLQLIECSDDSMILWGEKAMTTYMPGVANEYLLITLDRAETNPHAGKSILELYAPYSSVDVSVGDAIIKFNDTNGKYFIEAADRYSDTEGNFYTDVNSEDDWQKANLKYNASMSNDLAMDILNGEGPDILLNTSSYGQLNSDNYLVDLNKFIGTLDSGKYFTNIVDAAENDGKLYQLPICYMINGIQTKPEYAGKSGVGFTTEEYEKFLKNELNGKDVLNYGQAAYFSILFAAMNDKFLVDGKADFSGPEFAALAEFVKDNVPEKAKSWDELYNNYDVAETYSGGVGVLAFKGDTTASEQIAVYTATYGFNGYLSQIAQLNGATAILGIPSADGRGPLLDSYLSIAVSAQSKSVDACGEFIKMLMTDDVQMDLAKGGNFVLNKEAFRQGAKEAVDFMNGPGGESYVGYDMNTGEPLKNRMKFSQKNVDDLEKIISSVSRMNSMDAAIGLILVEEMPAYFSGQKNLEDVIKIAQDRAQKVIGERG